MNLAFEARTIEAVLDELGVEQTDLFGYSCGGGIGVTFAHQQPERVGRMVFYGSYADGMDLAPLEVRVSMLAMVRAHWGFGSRMLAEMFVPEGDMADRTAFADIQREAASPDTAAWLLQLTYDQNVMPLLGELDVPVQVLHRRGDQAVPFDLGRRLAAGIRGARFVPFEGDSHMPWQGESGQVVAAVRAFLDGVQRPAAANGAAEGDGLLSDREVEILRMVSKGLSDRQIAEALVLSPHTVHRHVANIRTKLRQPTRTAAATEAARLQLI
jgi:pimeloyl-ACP methyl ester carboxylesterase/DNA-binding CsgD family transcriptional regulator